MSAVSTEFRILIDWESRTRFNKKSFLSKTSVNILNADNYTSGPRAASNLTVTNVGETTVDLDWDPSPDAGVSSYTVYVYNNDQDVLEQEITGIVLSEADVVGLTMDEEYEFWVTAVENGIESLESNHVTATPVDVTPPDPVTNLSILADQHLSLSVSWTASVSSDVVSYNVFLDGSLYQNITGTSIVISPLTANQQYTVSVTALDGSGNESTAVAGTETALDLEAPNTPTGLTVDSALNNEIDISWDANTESDIALYRVYVDGSEHAISPVSHPTVTATITGLNNGQQYSIQISAEDSNGNESSLSSPVTATIQDTEDPDPVTNFTVASVSSSEIEVSWTDSVSSDVDYISLRLDGVEVDQIAEGVQSYTFTGLSEETQYTVSAVVVDTFGNQSSEVSETATTTKSGAYSLGYSSGYQ